MTASAARVRIALALSLPLLLALAAPAQAHRVNVFAWVEGDVVHAEGTFAGGKKPSMDSPLDVLDAATGEKYLEMRTDDQGAASFTIPQAARDAKADLKLVLHASMGHQAEWVIKAAEYLGADAGSEPVSGEVAAAAPAAPVAAQGAQGIVPMDDAALRQLVETAVAKAVESHVAPLKRMLAEQQTAGPTLSDIVGGLGWIAGLVGVGAWVSSRRRRS